MELPLDWLASTFNLGHARRIEVGGRGQSSPFDVQRLETSQGVFAIKRFDQAPRPAALAIELAAYEAGFPLPQPLRTADGMLYATHVNAGRPTWVRAYAWVEGKPYEWGTVDSQISAHMGGLLAAMHAIPAPAEALRDDSWMPLGRSQWEQLAQVAAIKHVPWAQDLREKITALVAWEEHVVKYTASDQALVASQRDLHPPNVIQRSDGSHTVIDWDGAGPVRASEDVAMFALVWASAEDKAPSRDAVRAFIRGYRDAGGHFELHGINDLSHRERALLAWIAYNVQRHIDQPPGPNPWLPPALLSGVHPPDLDGLRRTAALFEGA